MDTYYATWRRHHGQTVLAIHPQPVPESGPVAALLCAACQPALRAAAAAGAAAVQALAQRCVAQHD